MKAVCYKCKANYDSADESDLAGDGFCPSCLEQKKAIAAQVDAKFAGRVYARKPTLDELPKMPGTNFINAKAIMGW